MTMAQERTVPLSATGPASVKRRRLVLAKISVALAVLATAVLWVLLTPATPPVLPVSGMVVHVTGTPGLAFSGGITYPDGNYRHVGGTVPWSSSPFPCDSGQLTVGFEKQGTGAMTVDFILNGTVVKSANRGPADSSGLLIAYAC